MDMGLIEKGERRKMNAEEIYEIVKFISEHLIDLDVADQAIFLSAFSEFGQKMKPVYEKYKLREEGGSFLFRL